MSKRFSVLAAALVVSGRSDLTTFIGCSSSRRMLEIPTEQVDDPSIEERTRLVFDDSDEGVLRREHANFAIPCDFPFDP